MTIPLVIGVNPLQTTLFRLGIVSGRVALLLRSAEIHPVSVRFVSALRGIPPLGQTAPGRASRCVQKTSKCSRGSGGGCGCCACFACLCCVVLALLACLYCVVLCTDYRRWSIKTSRHQGWRLKASRLRTSRLKAQDFKAGDSRLQGSQLVFLNTLSYAFNSAYSASARLCNSSQHSHPAKYRVNLL